jgi:outer membrane receptor protein involved in Fe transport
VEWLEFYGSYTYDDVEITRDRLTMLEGNRIPLVPKHRGTAGARVFGPFYTEAGVNANIVGSRVFINDSANTFDQMDAFQVVDGHLAWRPQIGEHVRLGFEFNVYNMLDKQYEEVGGIRTVFDPVTFLPMGQKRFFPSPERNYEVRFLVEVRR